MTRYLLDVASYQGALKADDVRRAGFTVVNLKVSHGLSRKSVHPDITGWVQRARAAGLGISTFHYMTADAEGSAQARYAYERIRELGLGDGTAHQLDVECEPAPALASVRSYLTEMTRLLGRPVVLYTGDWWWAARGKWDVSALTPYVWAAPNAGYIGSYPGDASAHWRAGYGGWADLAVMQYGVGRLSYPDGTRGTIEVSKSAIRDERVWTALTTRPAVQAAGRSAAVSNAPQTLKDARNVFLVEIPGMQVVSMGIVGDAAHAEGGDSYHLGADQLRASASYSVRESTRDSKPTDAASGLDIGWFRITRGGKTHDLRTFNRWLVAECEAGAPDTKEIREVIYSLDGVTVKRWDRLGRRTGGSDSHTTHTHVSRFRDAENSSSLTRLFKRYFVEIEGDDMSAQDVSDIKAAIAAAATDIKGSVNGQTNQVADEVWLRRIGSKVVETRTALNVVGDLAATRAGLTFSAAHPENVASPAQAGSPLHTMQNLPAWQRQMEAQLAEQDAKLDQILAALQATGGGSV